MEFRDLGFKVLHAIALGNAEVKKTFMELGARLKVVRTTTTMTLPASLAFHLPACMDNRFRDDPTLRNVQILGNAPAKSSKKKLMMIKL